MSVTDTVGVRVLPRSEHPISRDNIAPNALKVLYRLHHAGYKAYLVGGSVRDLMLGRRPKDFDVGTDARPNEIRRVFRNARIIGRRFRLVHVLFHGEVVEVSTFRRDPSPEEQAGAPDELLITSDNTFGSPRRTPSAATSRSTRCSTTSPTSPSSTIPAASRTSRRR